MAKGTLRFNNMAEVEALKNRNIMFQKKNLTVTKRPRPRHEPGKMNKSEEAYSRQLEAMKHLNQIRRWVFEPFKLRLADRTFYEFDFMVVKEEHIEIHEFKGHWEDDARVKIKVAAELFPEFLFVGVTMKKGSYEYEYFNV
jgi:hypothetical protein